MYKDYRYINAGENEIYRWGRKAREYVKASLEPNERGYYSIATDAGKYWTIGTSEGKYGTFANVNGTIFSVNKGGYMYAKAGTEKGDLFVKALNKMIESMIEIGNSKIKQDDEEEED